MEFKPLFYSFLVLCLIVFFDVLINVKKQSLLKICFLLIISSLFAMNYFSYMENLSSRYHFVMAKSMRTIFLCSTLLLIVHFSSSKIPRWIISAIAISFVFLLGMRIYYFNDIDTQPQKASANLIFSVAHEFYNPLPILRLVLLSILSLALYIIIYYYSVFRKKAFKSNVYYNVLQRWLLFFIVPSFLLILFGMLSLLNVFQPSFSSGYLFSLFSLIIVVSILFRPKFLNTSQVSLAFIPLQKTIESSISVQLFNNIFFNEFYYLNKDASLAELSHKLKTSEPETRQFLQQEYGMGMNDLLNKYRVSYLLDLLKDPQNRDFTIEYLSQKAGFPSRTTMYRAFSKYHGGSPTDFIDRLTY